MEKTAAALTACVALICLIVSILQFNCKGFLFNNAYIYASKAQKAKMDKKPYYIQSGIIFALLTGAFSFLSVELLTGTRWPFIPISIFLAGAIAYAIVSTILMPISKNQ